MQKGLLPIILFLWSGATVMAESALPVGVSNALRYRNVPSEALSAYVQEIDSGKVVLAWNEAVPRNPASVEKMVTTLVALDKLGPDYRWKTELTFMGDVDDGELDGDLLIKGYGDPYLVTERVWQMLRAVRREGVDTINGDLLLDDSYFDVGDYDPAAFDHEPLRAYNVSPNALLTNFKVVRYQFEPAADGVHVLVRLDPELRNIDIVNRLRIGNGACRGYQRGITLTPNDDVSKVTFSGRFPSGCEVYSMTRTALSHNEFTYGVIRSLWTESGGRLTGTWRRAQAPDGLEPDIVFDSLPLSEVIAKVNKFSNNVMAKQLLFTLGAEEYGAPGTEAKGRQVVAAWLAEHGMDFDELKVENGAGLSRSARMTARQLAAMLRFAFESPYMPEYLASLSLSGMDGTLSRRFEDGALTGQAHMKTGSLDDVSAVAGYFQARSGKRYVVVVMLNHTGVQRGPGTEVQEMLLRWLYDY